MRLSVGPYVDYLLQIFAAVPPRGNIEATPFFRHLMSGTENLSYSPNTQLPDPIQPMDSAETIAAPVPRRDPPWTFWDVAMMVVVALAGMVLFGTVIGIVLRLRGVAIPAAMSPLMLKVILGAQCLAYIVVLIFMYQLVTRQYHRGFGEAVRWLAPAAATWPYFLGGGVALSFLVGLIGRLLPFPPTLPIDKYFQDASSAWLMTIFGVSMAPLVEELFYRGFLYPVLARRLGVSAGTVITAAAFALMHSSQLAHAWAPLLVLFVVGLVLTIVRIVTDSVVCSFLMHVGYNATLFTFLYIGSDGFRHLEKVIQQ